MPQSITVVMPDGTIWTCASFNQVTPPATTAIVVEVDLKKSDGSVQTIAVQ